MEILVQQPNHSIVSAADASGRHEQPAVDVLRAHAKGEVGGEQSEREKKKGKTEKVKHIGSKEERKKERKKGTKKNRERECVCEREREIQHPTEALLCGMYTHASQSWSLPHAAQHASWLSARIPFGQPGVRSGLIASEDSAGAEGGDSEVIWCSKG